MNFIKCEKLEKSMAELQFSIDAEAFKGAVADVFKKEGKKYSVPGLPMMPSMSCSPLLTRQL